MTTAKKAALILGILVAAACVVFAPSFERDRFTLTLVGFSTNEIGVRTAIAEFHSAAFPCTYEVRLLVVTEEEYTNAPAPARVPMTSYMKDGKVVYYLANKLAATNTPIQRSTGPDLQRGQTARLTLAVPESQGWCLSIACSRIPAPPTLADRISQLNHWASGKFGLPQLFSTRNWSGIETTTPIIPPELIANGQIPDHVRRTDIEP